MPRVYNWIPVYRYIWFIALIGHFETSYQLYEGKQRLTAYIGHFGPIGHFCAYRLAKPALNLTVTRESKRSRQRDTGKRGLDSGRGL